MGRWAAAILGLLGGVAVGLALLVLTHPAAAYTNDAYRAGASAGFVARYAILGVVAALLLGLVRRREHPALVGLGIALVIAAAVVPLVLDDTSDSEQRRAAAVAVSDPQARERAELRAGAIDGCANGVRRQVEDGAAPPEVGADAYCACFIDAILQGPAADDAQLDAVAAAVSAGKPTPRMARAARRCARAPG